MKSGTSMFRAIALDLAQRIVNGEFADKVPGRTILASHYNASTETIRKSIALLKIKQVVSVSQGKDVEVISSQNAHKFIEHYKSTESVFSLKQKVETLLQQKRAIDEQLEALLDDIINYSDKLRNLSPYNPVEIEVQEKDSIADRSVSQVRLWQNTGATIVAIRRGPQMIISPGPDAKIKAGDHLVVVGNPDVMDRTIHFIKKNPPD